MNPYQAYREYGTVGWSRIDLLIALYDGALGRLEQARQSIARGERQAAAVHLVRTQRIIAELIAGVDLKYNEISWNLLRLYDFVLRSISGATPDIESAVRVLSTIRDGLEGIRGEAVRLERSGEIPPVDQSATLLATG